MSENFGIYLKEKREAKGVSLRMTAYAIRVSPTTLHKIEAGEMSCPPRRIPGLARYLALDPDEAYWVAGLLPPDIEDLMLEAGPQEWQRVRRAYGREAS